MLAKYFLIFFCSFLSCVIFVLLLKRLIPKRKAAVSGISSTGGIGIGLSFVLSSFFFAFLYLGLSQETIGIITVSVLMLIFGVIDDWLELSILAKTLIQIFTSYLLILFGIRTQIIYIGNLPNIIITLIWVIGITNAFNHLDIIDGLAGSEAIIASLAFFVISVIGGDIRTSVLALSLAGATSGFIIYNLPPARIYMGNSGSHFLGFVLAAIAVVISYAPLERKIALITPLLILGLPIFDTAFLIMMRIFNRRSIFKKSNDHFALRLIRNGHSKEYALLFMLGLGLFFAVSGIYLNQASTLEGLFIIILVVITSLILGLRISKVAVDA